MKSKNRKGPPPLLLNKEQMEKLDCSVVELGLSVRTVNNLERNDVLTVKHLLECCPLSIKEETCRCSRLHLADVANLGSKTQEEIYDALERWGFTRASRRKWTEKTRGYKASNGSMREGGQDN